MRRLFLVGLALLLLAALPCSAQSLFSREAEDRQGLVVWLEAFGATASNGPFEYATVGVPQPPGPGTGGGGGGEILTLDFDPEVSPRVAVGWDFGAHHGTLALRYWSTTSSASDAVDTGVFSYGVGEILMPPTFFDGRADGAEAEAELKVNSIDLEYALDFGRSKRASGYWRVGIRSFSYEQTQLVDYFLQAAPIDQVTIASEVTGVGPLVGLGGTLELHPRVRLLGDLGLAYLIGKADYEGEWLVTETTLYDTRFTLTQEGQDRSMLQVEASLGASVRLWRGLEVAIGYRFIDLQDVARRASFVDDVDVNAVVFSDQDVNFGGPFIALSWAGPFKK
jgi:hypothetical protein